MYFPLSRIKSVQRTKVVQFCTLLLILSKLAMLMLSPGFQLTFLSTNPLDGCVYVYLDMGTNIGVQIRNGKIFIMVLPLHDVFQGNFLKHKNSKAPMSLKYFEMFSSRTLVSLVV